MTGAQLKDIREKAEAVMESVRNLDEAGALKHIEAALSVAFLDGKADGMAIAGQIIDSALERFAAERAR